MCYTGAIQTGDIKSKCVINPVSLSLFYSLYQARLHGLATRAPEPSGIMLKWPAVRSHTAAYVALKAWRMCSHRGQR